MMKEEAKKIGEQLHTLIAAKQPETMALQALCATMRLGNKPGGFEQERAGNASEEKSPVELPSSPAIVGLNLAVLWVLAPQFEKGEQIIVTWSHPAPTSGDWIGMYLDHESERNYITYQWVDPAATEVTFVAPSSCGHYNFRYFHNKTYNSHGCSPVIAVGPQFSLSTTKVSPNEIGVKIDQKSGEVCPNLWVALYPHGETNPKSYLSFKWAKAGDDLSFEIPKAGSWNFKVFSDRGYDYTTSYSVTVPGNNSLTLKQDASKAVVEWDVTTVDPAKDSVWVGIFRVDQTDSRYYQRYKYISTHKGSLEVSALKESGVYEARLFAHGTYDVLCSSETRITVQ
jgi:hypothetical protein